MSHNMTTEKMEESGHSPYFNKSLRYERNRPRFRTILLRTFGYSMATIFRLFYMLITMTMNSQIFVIVVVGLTTGQLIVEYLRSISAYTSRHNLIGMHSSVNLSHKDDDDIPSATTLGNESISDKIVPKSQISNNVKIDLIKIWFDG
ncbi:13682_t:CDS:2 [Dentiscutata erythropus]|uniref:Copper transport protein n=1 Tax=Dentiscutata erythropus TaxID=1348616 RepID=A0A9N9CXC4_9GLOM|nr:13682_t:CDS:2 [Dentiscutata erythropus]